MRSESKITVARIIAWTIALGLVTLMFVAPIVVTATLFLVLCAFAFVIKWRTAGKWAAIKEAIWTLLTGW